MATVNKDFRVKNGLVVEGATATVDGENILTEGSTTDQLPEGSTNLYFSDARVETALGSTDTDSLPEGIANLYFTDQRAQDAVTNNLTTDDLDEGLTNLYYTDGRVRSAISGGTGITYTSGTGEIAVDTSVIASRTYVDTAVAGLNWKAAVNLFSTSNVALSGSSDTLVIDGHSALGSSNDGYRLLLTGQSTDSENGIYVYNDAGSGYTLTRPADSDSYEELIGASVFVMEGTTYGSTSWVQANHYLTDFTSQEWDQFSGQGTYTAGTGLTLTGNEFSLSADTDDVTEGATNLYFTDERAQDAIATAIAAGSHTNISITYDDNANSISFSGSSPILTTDDLDEGSTNLYFTDARAVSAIDGASPDFQDVTIDSISKVFAVTTTIASADTSTTAYTFDSGTYRSAKITFKFAYGAHTEVSEVLLTLDTSDNIAITEYGIVQTNGSLGSITAAMDGTDIDINVTVPNASTTATIFGTLIA